MSTQHFKISNLKDSFLANPEQQIIKCSSSNQGSFLSSIKIPNPFKNYSYNSPKHDIPSICLYQPLFRKTDGTKQEILIQCDEGKCLLPIVNCSVKLELRSIVDENKDNLTYNFSFSGNNQNDIFFFYFLDATKYAINLISNDFFTNIPLHGIPNCKFTVGMSVAMLTIDIPKKYFVNTQLKQCPLKVQFTISMEYPVGLKENLEIFEKMMENGFGQDLRIEKKFTNPRIFYTENDDPNTTVEFSKTLYSSRIKIIPSQYEITNQQFTLEIFNSYVNGYLNFHEQLVQNKDLIVVINEFHLCPLKFSHLKKINRHIILKEIEHQIQDFLSIPRYKKLFFINSDKIYLVHPLLTSLRFSTVLKNYMPESLTCKPQIYKINPFEIETFDVIKNNRKYKLEFQNESKSLIVDNYQFKTHMTLKYFMHNTSKEYFFNVDQKEISFLNNRFTFPSSILCNFETINPNSSYEITQTNSNQIICLHGKTISLQYNNLEDCFQNQDLESLQLFIEKNVPFSIYSIDGNGISFHKEKNSEFTFTILKTGNIIDTKSQFQYQRKK